MRLTKKTAHTNIGSPFDFVHTLYTTPTHKLIAHKYWPLNRSLLFKEPKASLNRFPHVVKGDVLWLIDPREVFAVFVDKFNQRFAMRDVDHAELDAARFVDRQLRQERRTGECGETKVQTSEYNNTEEYMGDALLVFIPRETSRFSLISLTSAPQW